MEPSEFKIPPASRLIYTNDDHEVIVESIPENTDQLLNTWVGIVMELIKIT
jgi:hypothetical protein